MDPELPTMARRVRNHLAGSLAHGDADMTDVPGSTAAELVELYADIERSAAMLKLKAAARVAETDAWRSEADPDAESWLSRKTGTSKRSAKRSLDAAQRLDEQPETRAAAERGELSETQLQEVSEAVDANPDAEAELLDSARNDSYPELRTKASRAKGSAGDSRTRQARIKRERFARWGTDDEGAFYLNLRNTADVGARIVTALSPHLDDVFDEARQSGEPRESFDARAADAVERAICGEPASKPAARGIKTIVRIDLQALRRGHTDQGELCEVVGLGQVPVAAVRELLADSFLSAVVTDGEDPKLVANFGRHATAIQQTALEWTQPTCDVRSCGRTMFLENHHDPGYAQSLRTVFDELDRFCETHHDLYHHGWRLEPGKGKRRFLSPEEQRLDGWNLDPPGDPPAA